MVFEVIGGSIEDIAAICNKIKKGRVTVCAMFPSLKHGGYGALVEVEDAPKKTQPKKKTKKKTTKAKKSNGKKAKTIV